MLDYKSYSLRLKGKLDHFVAFLAAQLVHISRRFRRYVHKGTDHSSRYANGDGMVWQILNHERPGTNLASIANANIAQSRAAGTEKYSVSYFGMTVDALLARSAKCNVVQYGAVVTDLRRFTDHDAGSVI